MSEQQTRDCLADVREAMAFMRRWIAPTGSRQVSAHAHEMVCQVAYYAGEAEDALLEDLGERQRASGGR